MLTLNQLLKLKEKTEYSINRLNIKTSDFGDLNTDYEISGLMPVKINIKTDMNIDGIEFNLRDLVHKYAKEKHGSRHIVISSIKFPKDHYLKDYKILKETGFQYVDKDHVPDPDFVEIDSDYITFNILYSYHRHTKKYSDDRDNREKKWKEDEKKYLEKRDKENKNKKEK